MCALLVALAAGCGGGSSDGGPPNSGPDGSAADVPPVAVANYVDLADQLSRQIVEATGPAAALEATSQALVSGGVRVHDAGQPALAARLPAASWDADRGVVFNLAAEAHDRAVSGRLTVDDLARMWADLGFPFTGAGTPGEQLLGFLRETVLDGRARPAAGENFAPLFVAAMALHQDTPADLADAATRPEDVRLTLLEVELLHAHFDRAFEWPATASVNGLVDPRRRALAAGDGLCADLKNLFGTIGGKAFEAGLKYAQGQITEKALLAIGMTKNEVALFGKYGKMFGALGSALKLVKLAQIYASGQATLTIEGPNPVSKPAFNGARVLVPVKATAGVPDAAWQDYQKNNSSEAYQGVKSCLESLGAPLPLDLKDIAKNASTWRVSWDLVSGSPKHAVIPSDVNVFDASSAGNPFTMKLAKASESSAEATLRVDIKPESQLATLFQGPLLTSNVRVRVRVQTAEPPSPAVLAGVVSLAGTIASVVDLSVGWIQAMLPPTTHTTIKVQYHDEPAALDGTMQLQMTYDPQHIRGQRQMDRHTLSGTWTGKLQRENIQSGDETYAYFHGDGTFAYAAVSTQDGVDDSGCTWASTYRLRNGAFQMNVGPAVNASGDVLPDGPEQLSLGGGDTPPAGWPSEQRTVTVRCPKGDPSTVTFPYAQAVFVGAANAMNLQDALFMTEGYPPPGLYLKRGRLLSDGTLELSYTNPITVSVIVPGAATFDTRIVSQNTLIRLRPTYAPAGP